MKRALLGIASVFLAFTAQSAHALTVDYRASNYRNYVNIAETDCFNVTSNANCPIGWNVYTFQNKSYVNYVPSPLVGTSTETDLQMGFGFRAGSDTTINSIKMPVLTNNSGARIKVNVVLGDDPNASSTYSTSFEVPRAYTENEKTLFSSLMDDPESVAIFPTPVVVHAGEMVWFRLSDGSLMQFQAPTKFYGLYYFPIGCDQYNGCITATANATSSTGLYYPSSENQSRNIIGLRHWEGNDFSVLGQFVPMACDIYGDCSWRYNSASVGPQMMNTFQFSVTTDVLAQSGTGSTASSSLSSFAQLEPQQPTFIECDYLDIPCGLRNMSNAFIYIVKHFVWSIFDTAGTFIKWLLLPTDPVSFSDIHFDQVVPFAYFSYLFNITPADLDSAYQLKLPDIDTGEWHPLALSWYGITENETSANILRNFVTTFIILSVVGGLVSLTKLT